jgi:hypothetical protein
MFTEAEKPRRRYDSKYIVHSERRFVYFVIQKGACSSIKTALLPLFRLDPSRYWDTNFAGERILRVHKIFDRSPHQIDRAELLDGEYDGHFKFAFVRNPWDRLVSCYSKNLVEARKNLNPPGEERFYPDMPFAEFVEAVHATPDGDANQHFRSQHVVVCDPQGLVMADFVGHFEDLRGDFARVAEGIGAPGLDLPHRLKSKGRESRHYKDFYDARLKGLVAERYERDIETFGYSY